MSSHPSDQPPSRPSSTKITPKKSGGIPPEMVIGGAVIGLLLVAMAAIIALTNDSGDPDAIGEPTAIPRPTLANGESLAAGAQFFVVEESAFSVAAGAGLTNEGVRVNRCQQVEVLAHSGSDSWLGYDDGAYWVHAAAVENPSVNGWLPLGNLSQQAPADCPPQAD